MEDFFTMISDFFLDLLGEDSDVYVSIKNLLDIFLAMFQDEQAKLDEM